MPSEALESALFLESPTDLAWYHSIPARGFWPDLSPADVGLEVHGVAPTACLCTARVSPLEGPKALEDLERQVDRVADRRRQALPGRLRRRQAAPLVDE